MSSSLTIGMHYEEYAYHVISNHGLKLILRNYFTPYGEIDLIMQDKNCIAFIEVRYRKNKIYGDAKSTISKRKQNKIIKSAYHWMVENELNIDMTEFRFDVFSITGNHHEWIKNAFL